MTVRRVLVTGSRDWPDPNVVWTALDSELFRGTLTTTDTLVVVHGACPTGADLEADRWVKARSAEIRTADIRVKRYPADWARFGRSAGPLRNLDMVGDGADQCLAFICHGSRGASHCAELAEQAGIRTLRWIR